jgi:hypothetical protein
MDQSPTAVWGGDNCIVTGFAVEAIAELDPPGELR